MSFPGGPTHGPGSDVTMDDTPCSDPQALARLARWGGATLVREVTALFRTEVPARLEAAREAAAAGQCAAVRRAAHSLRSSCAQLGALRMSALSEKVEMLSAQGTLDPISALLDLLEEEFASFMPWLEGGVNSVLEVER